jgi:PAS domain S-box-containing protein
VTLQPNDTEARLRDQLKTAQAMSAAVINAALDAVIIADGEGCITGFNPAAERTFGYKAADVLGRALSDTIVPPHLRAAHIAGMKRHQETGESRVLDQRLELEAMRADGTVFPAEISIHKVSIEGSPVFAAYLRDLTAAKEAERRIREQEQRERAHQSEKLSAMGSLLAGVAHELNNPLAVAVAYSAMLAEMAETPSLKQRALKVNAAAERCARIVKSFLAMVRQKPPLREPTDLNQLAAGVCDMLAYGLKSAGVDVMRNLDPGLPAIEADQDLFSQVIANLVVNAQQALAERPDPRQIWIETRTTGDGVVLDVSDNGPGIPRDVALRIFEPYFTTKPAGVGTGLGLAICRNVVQAHGGKLDYLDRPDGGARFRIYMPAADTAAVARVGQQAPVTASMAILVVDDDLEVAEMLGDILEAAGHTVTLVHAPEEALAAIGRNQFDAVFTDLRMPRMNGADLRNAIAAADPRLGRRTVVMTGDTIAGPVTIKAAAAGHQPGLWIEKPFLRDELLELLARLQAMD